MNNALYVKHNHQTVVVNDYLWTLLYDFQILSNEVMNMNRA